jgi:hypothetical protein
VLKRGKSSTKKAFEAIRQIHRYMVQNGLMYGFLTTWNQWWFMRTNGQTLSISSVFPHDAGNPTVCLVLGRMLLQAMKSFKLEEDGYEKRIMKKKIDISLLPFFSKKTHSATLRTFPHLM